MDHLKIKLGIIEFYKTLLKGLTEFADIKYIVDLGNFIKILKDIHLFIIL